MNLNFRTRGVELIVQQYLGLVKLEERDSTYVAMPMNAFNINHGSRSGTKSVNEKSYSVEDIIKKYDKSEKDRENQTKQIYALNINHGSRSGTKSVNEKSYSIADIKKQYDKASNTKPK
jgi:hypothetical protein